MEVEMDPDHPQVPVVDISHGDEEVVAVAVVKASEEYGIFQMVNHGIPMELIQRLQEAAKRFFELPEPEKEKVGKPLNSTNTQGYAKKSQQDLQGRKALVDHIFHNLWPTSCVDYSYWPTNPPNFRYGSQSNVCFVFQTNLLQRSKPFYQGSVNEEYARHVEKLLEKILRWLSEGLGLQHEALREGLGGDTMEYMMKVNYYPPCPHETDLVVGLQAHTDINGLTLLVPNDIPGLQVLKDGHWLDVEYTPSAVIVIIGDQIMRLSNGRYKNVWHRAKVDKEETRMSWAALLKPSHDMVIGSLPELTTGDDNPKFKPLAYEDYKHRKLHKLPLD